MSQHRLRCSAMSPFGTQPFLPTLPPYVLHVIHGIGFISWLSRAPPGLEYEIERFCLPSGSLKLSPRTKTCSWGPKQTLLPSGLQGSGLCSGDWSLVVVGLCRFPGCGFGNLADSVCQDCARSALFLPTPPPRFLHVIHGIGFISRVSLWLFVLPRHLVWLRSV